MRNPINSSPAYFFSVFLLALIPHLLLAQCPSGYFENMDGDCQACYKDCTECNGPQYDNCTVCSGAFALTTEGYCSNWCTIFSTRVGNVCVPCAVENCRQCEGPGPSDCSGCSSPLYVLQGAACVDSCPDGSYPGYGQCKDCDSTCATCTGPQNFSCATCKSTLLFFRGRCLPTCLDGTYQIDQRCEICNQDCALCEGQASNCTTCKDQSKLVQAGQCVDSCTSGFFQAQGRKCESCPQNCEHCSNSTTCLQCEAGFFFHNGACVASCPMGTFTDQQNAICKDCPSQCNSCDSNLSCLNCRGGFGVNNGQCVVCEQHQFLNPLSTVCQECSQDCVSCSGSFNNCTACPSSSPYLYNNRCESSCPTGTFNAHNTCIQCPNKCSECAANGQCNKCDESSLLQEGSCVDTCAQGYYELNGTCKRCVAQISQIASFAQKDIIVKSCPAAPYTRSQDLGYYDYLEEKYEAALQNNKESLQLSEELLSITAKVVLASVEKSFIHSQTNFTIAKQVPSNEEATLFDGHDTIPEITLSVKPQAQLEGVLIVLWTEGLFEFDPSTSQSLVMQLDFVQNGQLSEQEITNPVQLRFTYPTDPPEQISVVKWDSSTKQWASTGINPLKSGQGNFTVPITNRGVYSVQTGSDLPYQSTFQIHYSIGVYALTLLIFASLFDCAVMCRHRGQFYPHRRVKLTRNKCIQLYSFSLLYNLPLFNICCYRSIKFHAIYRALWLSNMLSIVLTVIVCLAHSEAQLTPDPVANRLAVATILGICFIPHSLLNKCMVEWKVVPRESSSTDTVHSLHRPSQWKLFQMSTTDRQCTSPKSSKRQRKLSFQDLKGEEVSNGLGIATFFLFTLIVHGVATLFAYMWRDTLSEQLESIILSFSLSISVGLLYALIKQAIGSLAALHCRASKCMQLLFVDVLTKMVSVHQNPTVNCGIVTVSCSDRRA